MGCSGPPTLVMHRDVGVGCELHSLQINELPFGGRLVFYRLFISSTCQAVSARAPSSLCVEGTAGVLDIGALPWGRIAGHFGTLSMCLHKSAKPKVHGGQTANTPVQPFFFSDEHSHYILRA